MEKEVVIPILTIGFYNVKLCAETENRPIVVIPILTIGFYNKICKMITLMLLKVVIPILTIGFYNMREDAQRKFSFVLSYPS